MSLLGAFITARIVEKRLGRYNPEEADEPVAVGHAGAMGESEGKAEGISPEAEARGLRFALWGFLGVVAVITLLTAIPGAPLRNPDTGSVIGDSPFMESLAFMISLVVFVVGYAFGRGAGTIKTSTDVINAIVKQWGHAHRAALPVPAHCAVPGLLQLLEHPGPHRDRHRPCA